MSFIDGLSSGLDTTSIINQLMQIERRPQALLTSRRSEEEAARSELSEIRSEVSSLRTMAADLRLTSGWDRLTATSSDESSVTVEATAATATGSYTFDVTSVATAASVYSTDVFASTDEAVAAPGASVFSSSGHQSLGFETLTGTGFDPGDIEFSVVQSSEAAELEGAGIPAIPIEIDGTNDDIEFQVDGFNYSVSFTHDTYDSAAALAEAVADALAADPDASQVVTAALNESGNIVLSTIAEGSDHSIIVAGGDGAAAIGFSPGDFATGVDGIVEVDGAQTVIADASDGAEIALTGGAGGLITAVLNGPIREGTATVGQNSFGSGSLADVVSTVNANPSLGYTAAAVNTGTGYRLQLTATETGADSAIDVDPAIFGALDFTVLSEGTDAELTIAGENPFTITSSTNSFESLLPGVNITVNSLSDGPVTVSTERDLEAVTESVNEVVTKLNDILGRIASSTANNPGGARTVLQNHRAARQAASQLRDALVAPTEGNPFTAVGLVGIELTREGMLTFNQDAFKEKFVEDPEALTALFADRTGGEPGALDRLVDAAEAASSAGQGYLYTAGQATERRIDDYGKQIDAFEQRFEIREATLRRTYANLEVSLSGLQQQSGYLASQLGSLGGV